MIKKAQEKRNRYLRIRRVWEGGPITCLCCNLPSQLVSEGAVMRAISDVSAVKMSREEIGSLLAPIVELGKKKAWMSCPRCRRERRVPETKLYYVQFDAQARLGPMCLDCVSLVTHANGDRVFDDLPVWIVKCTSAALEQMQHINFAKMRAVSESVAAPAEELLY